MTERKKAQGKGECAGNKHFLLFLECFFFFSKEDPSIESNPDFQSTMLSLWICLNILLCGKGLYGN